MHSRMRVMGQNFKIACQIIVLYAYFKHDWESDYDIMGITCQSFHPATPVTNPMRTDPRLF